MKRNYVFWLVGLFVLVILALRFAKTGNRTQSSATYQSLITTQNGVITVGLQPRRSSNWSVVAHFPQGYTNSSTGPAPGAKPQ